MIKLKSEYAIQRKLGKSNRWEITYWGGERPSLQDCQRSIKDARSKYSLDQYRIIKINRSYEVVE
jgi:hypothetical protein